MKVTSYILAILVAVTDGQDFASYFSNDVEGRAGQDIYDGEALRLYEAARKRRDMTKALNIPFLIVTNKDVSSEVGNRMLKALKKAKVHAPLLRAAALTTLPSYSPRETDEIVQQYHHLPSSCQRRFVQRSDTKSIDLLLFRDLKLKMDWFPTITLIMGHVDTYN